MFLPVVVYFFTHGEITEYGAKPLEREFQIVMSSSLINFWVSIIGQLIAIIIMSDLLASEIDRGTMRLLLVKPIKKSEIVLGKFFAGMSSLAILYGLPFLVMQIYSTLLYKAGFEGITTTFNDLLFALGVTLLLLGSLGAFSMLLSVAIARPLYASLASFAVIFVVQYILPNLPFFDDPERFNLSYQIGVLLKKSFTLHTGLDIYKGDPNVSATFFLSVIILGIIFTLLAIYRKEYEG